MNFASMLLSAHNEGMGENEFTKLAEEKLDTVEEDIEEKASMADHDRSKQLEKELQWLKKQWSIAEEKRHKARTEADEANSRLSEAVAAEKAELDSMKKAFASKNQELKMKEEQIKSLNETVVAAKNVGPRVRELEQELERQKELEAKLVESLEVTNKELEQLKVSVEESRIAARSLRDKHEDLLRSDSEKDDTPRSDNNLDMNEMLENLSDELQLTKESLFRAQEGEKAALSKAQSLLSEIGKLRNELKLATTAEMNSAKAMDDLAIALSEVAAESNKVKLRLEGMEVELDRSHQEVEELKGKGKSVEEMYVSLLEEARRRAEEYKKRSERSTLEAEETMLAWNDKETEFVKCIRRAEEEKSLVIKENIRLLETIKSSKEENNKLRDILKQGLKEANVAKESANIAKAENSQLKDSLADKEESLEFLTAEIEKLKSKMKISSSSSPSPAEMEVGLEGSLGDKEKERDIKKPTLVEKIEESPKILSKAFSFNLKELRIHTKHHNKEVDSGDEKNKDHIGEDTECEDEDLEDYDPLKGSIFDVMDSPGSARHKRKESMSSSDGTTLTPEELAQLEDSHLHDFENGRFSSRRRRLLRKFGDLLIRRRTGYPEPSK